MTRYSFERENMVHIPHLCTYILWHKISEYLMETVSREFMVQWMGLPHNWIIPFIKRILKSYANAILPTDIATIPLWIIIITMVSSKEIFMIFDKCIVGHWAFVRAVAEPLQQEPNADNFDILSLY